eukprot:2128637-Rhodomonas_salina.1
MNVHERGGGQFADVAHTQQRGEGLSTREKNVMPSDVSPARVPTPAAFADCIQVLLCDNLNDPIRRTRLGPSGSGLPVTLDPRPSTVAILVHPRRAALAALDPRTRVSEPGSRSQTHPLLEHLRFSEPELDAARLDLLDP